MGWSLGHRVSRPRFISWTGHGAAASAPPAEFTGAHAYVFAFDADRVAIQALVDSLLNPATSGKLRYSAISSTAILSFVDVDRCRSLTEDIGWTSGRECGIWTPLWEHPADGGLGRLVMWAPYVFINYSLGLITGREVWGWPKFGATLGMSRDQPEQPANYTCRTMIFRDFGHDVMGKEETLIEVRGPHPSPVPHTPWGEISHGLVSIAEHLSEEALDAALRAHLIEPVLPIVALKQFRDSADPEFACYQAIVNSPCRLTRFHAGGLLEGPFELEFAQCRSHPILADMAGEPIATNGSIRRTARWSAWLNFDFIADPGPPVTA